MQYVKGHKKIQTPKILLRRNTIGDSEKHVSLRSLSFIRISQYIINCIYRFFNDLFAKIWLKIKGFVLFQIASLCNQLFVLFSVPFSIPFCFPFLFSNTRIAWLLSLRHLRKEWYCERPRCHPLLWPRRQKYENCPLSLNERESENFVKFYIKQQQKSNIFLLSLEMKCLFFRYQA